MNVLTIFDQRMTAIFEEGAPGARTPFSFKRLAKRAVREMEDETFVIDGVDTAPALYTVLVSQADDALMRPMYLRITDEISQLIEAQAKKRGYTFVGRPLVRFMVDPALRPGRFSVFAENIDPRTLARLRDEENAYLGITPRQDFAANQGFVPASVPLQAEEPSPVAQEVAFVPEAEPVDVNPVVPVPVAPVAPVAQPEVELDFMDEFDSPEPADEVAESAMDDAFELAAEEPDPFEIIPQDYIAEAAEELAAEEEAASYYEAPVATPEPELEPEPERSEAPRHAAHIAPAPAPEPEPKEPVCTLVDVGSGHTYSISTAQAAIGRERVAGGIVLSDPNVSRRHAELSFDGANWTIRDLNSTNGTLVNDVDVAEARLHDGDVLTIGLTNLEFREG